MRNTSIILFLCISQVLISQSFITVANNPHIDADHNTVNAAVAASSAGDSIYIHGGTAPYAETVVINHQLHIIGPGYFLDENNEYNTNAYPAIIDFIEFQTGSNHSIVEGITVGFRCRIYEDDITIRKNRFIFSGSASNNGPIEFRASIDSCLIYNNILHSSSGSAGYNCIYNSSSSNVLTNIFFLNNIAGTPLFINNFNPANTDLYAINNTFMRSGSSATFGSFSFLNNIFCISVNPYTSDPGIFENNLFNVDPLPSFAPAIAGNVGDIDMNDVFLNYIDLTGNIDNYIDTNFTILEPAPNPATINCAGIGCGATLGLQPSYRNSGIPEIPILYELTSDLMSDANGNINITVKAKAH